MAERQCGGIDEFAAFDCNVGGGVVFVHLSGMKCLFAIVLLFIGPGARSQRPGLLYLQTDKQVYTNNEYIWFSASLLHAGIDSISQTRLLCVTLIPCDTRIPVFNQKFSMADGFSFGSFKLPDTIAPGEYKLAAYTNRIGKDSLPVAFCTQDLLIHSLTDPEFRAAVTIMEDDLWVTVRDKTTYQPIKEAELEVWCNRKSFHGVTDHKGVWRLPVKQLITDSLVQIVKVKVTMKQGFAFVQKDIANAEAPRQLQIQFFPEGGHLLQNAPAHIGWKTVTDRGEPVGIKAVLYKNQQAIDTIGTDEWGMGAFNLLPAPGVTYSVTPIKLPPGIQSTRYVLPKVITKGMSLHTAQAVADDSLRLQIHAAGYDTIRMVLHNFRTLFWEQVVVLKNGRTPVLLVLDSIPRGVAAITLVDEKDQPIAQRLFFAHYDQQSMVAIQPDQPQYQKRQKVTLSFQSNIGSGIASVSVVQASRVLNNRPHDIERIGFGTTINDANWLEASLLVANPATPQNYAPYFSPVIQGKVIPERGKIKKPVDVTILNNQSGVSMLQSDASGNVSFTEHDLLVNQDQKLIISANHKSTTNNRLVINDPYTRIDQKLAATIDYRAIDAGKYVQFAQDLSAKNFNQAKELTTVTVTAKSSKLLYATTNECGDYVCEYNYLNCPNHAGSPFAHPAQKGQTYRMPGTHGALMMYAGCNPQNEDRVMQYDGIKIGREFVPEDLSRKTSGNPEYMSTLFWSPALVFDKDGKAQCSFYTSDITGRFRIDVNGITNNNLFYATAYIDVK